MQISDLNTYKKKYAMKLANVIFWRWINENTIAVVTNTSVYHWNTTSPNPAEKIFDYSDSNEAKVNK